MVVSKCITCTTFPKQINKYLIFKWGWS